MTSVVSTITSLKILDFRLSGTFRPTKSTKSTKVVQQDFGMEMKGLEVNWLRNQACAEVKLSPNQL